MERKACGRHVQLAANEAAKITQCPCGTVHVHLAANGLTLRFSEENLKNVTRAFMTALDKVEEAEHAPIN
jgi:hypothetical protein